VEGKKLLENRFVSKIPNIRDSSQLENGTEKGEYCGEEQEKQKEGKEQTQTLLG